MLQVDAGDGSGMAFWVNETTKIFDDILVPILPQDPHLEFGGAEFDVFRFVSLLYTYLPGRVALDNEYTSIEFAIATKILPVHLTELMTDVMVSRWDWFSFSRHGR